MSLIINRADFARCLFWGLVCVALIFAACWLAGCMDDDAVCVPNDVRCNAEDNTVEQCSTDGDWQTIDRCNDHEPVDLFEDYGFECCDLMDGEGPQCYMDAVCMLQRQFCFQTQELLDQYCEGVL